MLGSLSQIGEKATPKMRDIDLNILKSDLKILIYLKEYYIIKVWKN